MSASSGSADNGPVPDETPPLALTIGEPAGIGPEISLKAWAHREREALPPFFAIGDASCYRETASLLGANIPVERISRPGDALSVFKHAFPVLDLPLAVAARPGELAPENAAAVIGAIDLACDLALKGEASGIVTSPIHKRVLYEAGFKLPGHTEYLAELAGGSPVMMLSCPGLRVALVTIHMPLKAVAAHLSTSAIVETGTTLARALRTDFGIDAPRLAVAALNPHGGEEGHLGREEIEIIAPAIPLIRDTGVEVTGPLPADTLFHERARESYDAVLCMYHDQALIPLKTIDFERGVNTTLGLSIVRTSPDHGTALDIAGKGLAHPGSLIEAIRQAGEIAWNRRRTSAGACA